MEHGVQLSFIRPGRPMEDGFIESFNGRWRDEGLNVEWVRSLEEARQKLAAWRYPYNHQRPPGALGDRTPASVAGELEGKGGRCFVFSILDRALGGLEERSPRRRSAFTRCRRKWSTFIESRECTKPAFHAVRRNLETRIL